MLIISKWLRSQDQRAFINSAQRVVLSNNLEKRKIMQDTFIKGKGAAY
jgi:hypothetical protein